jgi:hypothetical protein
MQVVSKNFITGSYWREKDFEHRGATSKNNFFINTEESQIKILSFVPRRPLPTNQIMGKGQISKLTAFDPYISYFIYALGGEHSHGQPFHIPLR